LVRILARTSAKLGEARIFYGSDSFEWLKFGITWGAVVWLARYLGLRDVPKRNTYNTSQPLHTNYVYYTLYWYDALMLAAGPISKIPLHAMLQLWLVMD
jgi:hypothetical protein